MKIVFICNEYPSAVSGGIGTFTRGLGEALASRGDEVHVVGHYDLPSVFRESINGADGEVVVHMSTPLFRVWGGNARLLEVIK